MNSEAFLIRSVTVSMVKSACIIVNASPCIHSIAKIVMPLTNEVPVWLIETMARSSANRVFIKQITYNGLFLCRCFMYVIVKRPFDGKLHAMIFATLNRLPDWKDDDMVVRDIGSILCSTGSSALVSSYGNRQFYPA